MPIFNYKAKEMIVKIVYYGPGVGGKTTSIQYLHQATIPERKGELYFLATEADQTIYFELLPLYVGEIGDFKLRFQVYTVPGQVKYNNTRKAVLQGVDAIVFVADSQQSRQEANLISFKNLRYNLKGGYNLLLENIPLVFEYNKRDMKDVLTVAELTQDLNQRDLPYFETIATTGVGVLDAFEAISALAIERLEKKLLELEAQQAPSALKKIQKEVTQSPGRAPRSDFFKGEEKFHPERDGQIDVMKASAADQVVDVSPDGLIDLTVPKEEKKESLSYVDILAETYHNGEFIFEEGDPGDTMYFIEDGQVKIERSDKGTKKVLVVYEKGDFFGEMVLFGKKPRSARAVAVGATRLLPITRETLTTQIQNRPEIAVALLKTLSDRIRNNNKTISKLAEQNKGLKYHLKKARDTIEQLRKQNNALKRELDLARK